LNHASEEIGTEDILSIGKEKYHILGYESITSNEENILGAFIVKRKKRKKPREKAFFAVPPIPFSELEKYNPSINDCISISPPGDLCADIQSAFGVDSSAKIGPELSTLFIAFNFSLFTKQH